MSLSSNLFKLISVDSIILTLTNLESRERYSIAPTCKLFNNSIKSIKNNSIIIRWTKQDNELIDVCRNDCDPTTRWSVRNFDPYYHPPDVDPLKFEKIYNNQIKCKLYSSLSIEPRDSQDFDIEQDIFCLKLEDDKVLIGSNLDAVGIFVNDVLDLKSSKNNNMTDDNLSELGILIETGMNITSNTWECIGLWGIGVIIGDIKIWYTPFQKGSGYYYNFNKQYIRVMDDKGDVMYNKMDFVPNLSKDLHKIKIFISKESHIYVRIIDKDNIYNMDIQHGKSVFMDEKCNRLLPNTFGLIATTPDRTALWAEIPTFGNIYMNTGKRNIDTGNMSAF